MGEAVRRVSLRHTPNFHDSDVQMSLSKKEEISIHKEEVTEKGENIIRYGIHVSLS